MKLSVVRHAKNSVSLSLRKKVAVFLNKNGKKFDTIYGEVIAVSNVLFYYEPDYNDYVQLGEKYTLKVIGEKPVRPKEFDCIDGLVNIIDNCGFSKEVLKKAILATQSKDGYAIVSWIDKKGYDENYIACADVVARLDAGIYLNYKRLQSSLMSEFKSLIDYRKLDIGETYFYKGIGYECVTVYDEIAKVVGINHDGFRVVANFEDIEIIPF